MPRGALLSVRCGAPRFASPLPSIGAGLSAAGALVLSWRVMAWVTASAWSAFQGTAGSVCPGKE